MADRIDQRRGVGYRLAVPQAQAHQRPRARLVADDHRERAATVGRLRPAQCFQVGAGRNRPPLDGREAAVRNGPTNLAAMITEAMRREAGTSIAVFNGGSIRLDDVLPAYFAVVKQ